jgi:predicted thioesterase
MPDLEKLRALTGKTYTFSLTPDDVSLRWSENSDSEILGLISTSGLLKFVHGCGHSLLNDLEVDGLVSVVCETSLKHLSPVKFFEEITVNMDLAVLDGVNVKFSGTVLQNEVLRASFEFVRRFVSLDFLRRSVSA